VANENQQYDVVQQSDAALPVPVVTDAALGARGASRRRFARAGVGATGVLLTLASNPGMACSVNVGMSGYQSAVTAAKTGMKVSKAPTTPSNGLPPDRWAGGSGWPCATNIQFGHVFSCSRTNSTLGEKTLMVHCKGTTGLTGDKVKIAKLLTAAHLNVLSGRSPFLTLPALQAVWNEFQSKGQYTPMAGVTPWNAADIVTYLTGTMD
jgi:hypothetical protein